MSDKSRGVVVGVAGTLLVGALGGVAVNTSVASEQAALASAAAAGTINVCAKKTTGALRLLKPGKSCRRTEKLLAWNIAGPQGEVGGQGAAGASGAAGAAGLAGANGAQGAAGQEGPQGPEGPQGLPGQDGKANVSILDGSGNEVPDSFFYQGLSVIRDGRVWQLGPDGTLKPFAVANDTSTYGWFTDANCLTPFTEIGAELDELGATNFTIGYNQKYYLPGAIITPSLYSKPFSSCSPVGDVSLVKLGAEVQKPSDVAGPITVQPAT